MKLEGKVAVVVGGEGPLGRAVTKKFLSEGGKIVIGWYSPEEWEEAKGLIPSEYKGQFLDVHVDASKEEDVQKLMKTAKDAFGSIDSMLHMVGYLPVWGGLLWETETAHWERINDVILKSAFFCSKHAVKFMLEKKRGRLLFFTSRVTTAYEAGFGAAVVAKAGLITLTEILREELKETNITTNVVMFSRLDTWRTRKMANLPQMGARVDPEKWVKPVDVAELLCCLCTDECDPLSGATLTVFSKI